MDITSQKRSISLHSVRSSLDKTRKLILGAEADQGLLFKLFIYVILIDTAFIYLNPIFYMISTMVKNSADLVDPSVIWIPRIYYLGHLQEAWEMMNYLRSFFISAGLSTTIAILQTLSCAIAGYAFARLDFPFKRFLFICLLLTFIVPPQVTILPSLLAGSQVFGWIGTFLPLIVPAALGHGLKGALFVIIFRQFFSTQPKELEEAAKMDGANVFKIMLKVMMPLARPAIIVVFLFSFVWNWNDHYLPTMYLLLNENVPLSMAIKTVSSIMIEQEKAGGPSMFNEPIKMATSFLMILPLIILYAFTQRWFVESVERTGLVE